MSRRKEAPFVTFIEGEDRKTFRRKLKDIVEIRLTYGKSTFYDSHSGAPRYAIEIVGLALVKAVRKAKRCGEQLELSAHELRLWRQMFPTSGNDRFKPERKKRQVSA